MTIKMVNKQTDVTQHLTVDNKHAVRRFHGGGNEILWSVYGKEGWRNVTDLEALFLENMFINGN